VRSRKAGRAEFFARYLADYSPSVARDEDFERWFVQHMRQSASPGAAVAFQRMVMEGDVTDVLPTVRAPTLILCRPASAGMAEYVASRIGGAVWKDVPGLVDGYAWANPDELILRETEQFVRGLKEAPEPERVLVTVLFTDIVDSTRRAAELGDTQWKALLDRHDALVRQQLGRHRGQELNTTGTDSSPPSTAPAVPSGVRATWRTASPPSGSRSVPGCTRARGRSSTASWAELPSISPRACSPRPTPEKFSSRARCGTSRRRRL
jgi:hypothetical protein